MEKYHKIQTLFKRDEAGKIIEGDWSLEEFEYLQNNKWIYTEKIDGTNIRIKYFLESSRVEFVGKTDDSQISAHLFKKLQEIFPIEKFASKFASPICLYGEGYGSKINKFGKNYIADGVDFILFDVNIDGWMLRQKDIQNVANGLGLKVVPIVGTGTLHEAIKMVKEGFKSTFGDFHAEGLVVRSEVEMRMRNGDRIIGKIKAKDFK
jgi:ATP-dependent RNA circularization protein (DNA/RNA ligase family)